MFNHPNEKQINKYNIYKKKYSVVHKIFKRLKYNFIWFIIKKKKKNLTLNQLYFLWKLLAILLSISDLKESRRDLWYGIPIKLT